VLQGFPLALNKEERIQAGEEGIFEEPSKDTQGPILEQGADGTLKIKRGSEVLLRWAVELYNLSQRLHHSAAGLEEKLLNEAVEVWADVKVTPAYHLTKGTLPVFLEGTYHAIPVAAKSGRPFLVFTASQAGLEQVQKLLNAMGVKPEQYQIWVVENVLVGLGRAQQEFSSRFHLYPVNPQRPHWLQELLAGLEEQGAIPVGDLEPALQATERYFRGFM